jgi:hypothetical protein
MPKYEKHTSDIEMNLIKRAILDYQNGNDTQNECCSRYNIKKSTFIYYYNNLKDTNIVINDIKDDKLFNNNINNHYSDNFNCVSYNNIIKDDKLSKNYISNNNSDKVSSNKTSNKIIKINYLDYITEHKSVI